MPVPDFQSIMLPLLNLTADEKDHSLREAVTALAKEFRLTPDELAEMLPNPDKPEKKPLNHDGHNVAQRKILNALTSCSVVAFVVNSLLFVQEFHW